MASKPSMVPENAIWLVLSGSTIALTTDSKRACLEWIFERRVDHDTSTYMVYAPDSSHSAVIANQIDWEKSNG
jgi:hypothetical protein